MKIVSCGVIVFDGKSILLGHSTGNSFYDIPKGQIDDSGESFIDAAIRELEEETGIVVNQSDLIPLGRFEYTQKKDLELFLYKVEEMPSTKTLKCLSTFKLNGREFPEMDHFVAISLDNVEDYVVKSMLKVLNKIKELLKEKKFEILQTV